MNEFDGNGASTWPRVRQLATMAESGGIDSLWVYDHLVFRFPGEPEDGVHEAWTLLAAVAAVTERAELGTIVLGTGFRPPALQAKMAATLDEVVGRPPDPRARDRLARAGVPGLRLPVRSSRRAVRGGAVDHRAARPRRARHAQGPLARGRRRRPDPAAAAALQAPGRMPILIAAKGERVMRLTAKHADAWNAAWFGFPNDRFAQRRADLAAACEAEGRDPATLEVTVGLTLDAPGAIRPPRRGGCAATRRRRGGKGIRCVARPRHRARPGRHAAGRGADDRHPDRGARPAPGRLTWRIWGR